MDKHKQLTKPIVIDIRKSINGQNEIAKNANGKILNEGQEVSFVTMRDFETTIQGIKKQGYSIIQLISHGSAKKEDVESVLSSLSVVTEDKKEAVQKLIEAQQKEIDELKKLIKGKQEQTEEQTGK